MFDSGLEISGRLIQLLGKNVRVPSI